MEHRDLSGQVLDGRYRVVAPVGKGAMGSVYRAEHLKLGRVVAVKVMNEQVPDGTASRRRFEREAMAMAKLEHPHCASILDVGVHGDQPFVVMDFVSGRSLDALVAEGPLPIARAVEITRQILFGLAHAHEHGIIHRDIKPANIVLSQKSGMGDHVKILDFGLAKLSQETSNLTAGLIVGTPSYMAPEQILGWALDPRVDIYACGVLLFELLTGQKPFRAPSKEPLAICMMHLNSPRPRLSEVLPGRDFGALEEVVAHAIAKDRDHRFKTAGAFANALVAALSGQHVPSPPPATAPPMPPPAVPQPAAPSAATVELATAPPAATVQLAGAPPAATVQLADADLVEARSVAAVPRPPARKGRWLVAGGAIAGLAAAIVIVVLVAGGNDRAAAPAPAPAATPPAGSAPSAGAEPAPGVASGADVPPAPVAPGPPEVAKPDPVAELLAQADELVAARRREAAISLLVKARRTYPRDARLPYQAGMLYMEKLFWTDGLKQLRAALELDPGYRTDPRLIQAAIRAFNTTAQYDWALASFLRKDIGDAAKPALEEVARTHSNPIVRARATAELRRY